MGLQQRGIRAEYMGSAQTDRTVNNRAESGEFDVLYMTPEKACAVSARLVTPLLRICLTSLYRNITCFLSNLYQPLYFSSPCMTLFSQT